MRINSQYKNQVHTSAKCSVSIGELARGVIQSYESVFQSTHINVETDLHELVDTVYPQAIHKAVSNLIEMAIESMPSGGDLLITLVDGSHHWELEIADSSPAAVGEPDANPESGNQLARIIPMPQDRRMGAAQTAAMIHGGQVQTWQCPQGGQANVLVIPRLANVASKAA